VIKNANSAIANNGSAEALLDQPIGARNSTVVAMFIREVLRAEAFPFSDKWRRADE
jgi:hypothetical protein